MQRVHGNGNNSDQELGKGRSVPMVLQDPSQRQDGLSPYVSGMCVHSLWAMDRLRIEYFLRIKKHLTAVFLFPRLGSVGGSERRAENRSRFSRDFL
jgi:hypothetical protein